MALLPDLGRLLRSLSRDPRVPWHAKAIAAAAAVYVASPVDLLPDVVPGVGGVDDLVAVLLAVRRLVTAAGYDVVREHWTGTDDGFGVLIVLAGVGTSRHHRILGPRQVHDEVAEATDRHGEDDR